MNTEQKFNNAIEKWEAYYEQNIISSDPEDYKHSDSIEAIVAIGTEALPYIKKYLESTSGKIFSLAWVNIIERITKQEIKVVEDMKGKVNEIRMLLISVIEKP